MVFHIRSLTTLSDEQLRAIGCVAVESTYMDDLFDLIIGHLCCLDEHDFRVLTAGAQLNTKLKILRDVTRSRIDAKFAERHKALFDELSQQIAQRNNVIHGTWGVERIRQTKDAAGALKWVPEGKTWARRKKRGEVGSTLFEPKDIMETAYGLAEATLDLTHFVYETELIPARFVRAERPPPIQAQTLGSTATSKVHPPSPKKEQE